MKLQKIALFFALCLLAGASAFGQVNPETQIKTNGAAAWSVLVVDPAVVTPGANDKWKIRTSAQLATQLATQPALSKVIFGSGAPSGAPAGGTGTLYSNTANGNLYSWNGSAWALHGLISASNGLTASAGNVKLGGTITENTSLTGAFNYSVLGTTRTTFTATNGTRTSTLDLTSLSGGSVLKQTNGAQTGEIGVKSDVGNASYMANTDGTNSSTFRTLASQAEFSSTNGSTETKLMLQPGAATFTGLPAGITSKVLYINPSTKAISEGDAPSGGGGGGITRYSAGNGAIVTATAAGITFTRTTASLWTFNIPSGCEILSFTINNTSGESNTAALDLDFVFAGTPIYNQQTSGTDIFPPVMSTLKKSATPYEYPRINTATNYIDWKASVPSAGTLRIGCTDFSDIGAGGATTIKGVF